MQQQNPKSMKYNKMQQSKFSLPVTATDATSSFRPSASIDISKRLIINYLYH